MRCWKCMATGVDKAHLESCYSAAPSVPKPRAVARYNLQGLRVSVVSRSNGSLRIVVDPGFRTALEGPVLLEVQLSGDPDVETRSTTHEVAPSPPWTMDVPLGDEELYRWVAVREVGTDEQHLQRAPLPLTSQSAERLVRRRRIRAMSGPQIRSELCAACDTPISAYSGRCQCS